MKVLGLSQPFSGCGYHRVVLPLGFMDGIKGYVTNMPTPEILVQGWDVLTFNRLSMWDNDLQRVKDELRVKLVVDIDDAWNLPPNHINYWEYEKFKPRIESNLSQADLVTCTNERLAAKCRNLNKNVLVMPNALPFGFNQFTEDRRQDDRIRIFWAGGSSHEHDLLMLKNPIRRLSIYKDKIKMCIAGYTDNTPHAKYVWDRMFSYFTAAGTLPYMKIGGTGPENYMQLYENADIMLIPLEDSDWHGCKSNLKVLEAACKRIPVIVSKVEPYSMDADAPVLWVERQKDWFEHISFLVNNPDKRIELGNKLYEWATGKYNLLEVNKNRKRAFEKLISA